MIGIFFRFRLTGVFSYQVSIIVITPQNCAPKLSTFFLIFFFTNHITGNVRSFDRSTSDHSWGFIHL